MEKNSINNKTLEKLKYDLVRENLITYEDLEKAEEVATYRKQNIIRILGIKITFSINNIKHIYY